MLSLEQRRRRTPVSLLSTYSHLSFNNNDNAHRSRPPRLPRRAGGAGPRGARGRGTATIFSQTSVRAIDDGFFFRIGREPFAPFAWPSWPLFLQRYAHTTRLRVFQQRGRIRRGTREGLSQGDGIETRANGSDDVGRRERKDAFLSMDLPRSALARTLSPSSSRERVDYGACALRLQQRS